jgi:Fe-S cluster biogenesis protein NfuA
MDKGTLPIASPIDPVALADAIEYIRPAVQADGGDILLLGVDGGVVKLRLLGTCEGCPMVDFTLTAGIERILKERVPGVTGVVTA